LNASLSASQDNRSPDNNSLGQKQLVTSFNAFASVNWNIFDGFYTQALKQSSLISLRQLRNSRDQTEHDYRENLKSYVANLRFNWESLQTSEANLAGYRSSVDIFQKDYEVGLAPKKAWDDAKIVADNGLQAAISARADYYMQIVNYLSLRGKDPVVNPVTLKQPLNAAKN
jgi:outer membrane protein TolC